MVTGLIKCSDCGTPFEGDRREARDARWEPSSSATQWALDHGPMICLDCVRRLLDRVLEALAAWAAEQTTEASAHAHGSRR